MNNISKAFMFILIPLFIFMLVLYGAFQFELIQFNFNDILDMMPQYQGFSVLSRAYNNIRVNLNDIQLSISNFNNILQIFDLVKSGFMVLFSLITMIWGLIYLVGYSIAYFVIFIVNFISFLGLERSIVL